jgi:hypothetical protein
MACPYFDPVRPRAGIADPQSAMLPLGDSWEGLCRANSAEPAEPESGILERQCNLGYARESCSRFPAGGGPDAVRFTIQRDTNGSIGVYFVVERNHLPFAHGPLEFSRGGKAFTQSIERPLFERQARAYVESYLRRKELAGEE